MYHSFTNRLFKSKNIQTLAKSNEDITADGATHRFLKAGSTDVQRM